MPEPLAPISPTRLAQLRAEAKQTGRNLMELLEREANNLPQTRLQAMHDAANQRVITQQPEPEALPQSWPMVSHAMYHLAPANPDDTRLEAEVQLEIVAALRKDGYVVLEGLKGFTGGKVFIEKSVPDLTILKAGRVWFIELKRTYRYRISPEQIGMHNDIRAAGIPCWIAHDLPSVRWVLAQPYAVDPAMVGGML